MTHEMTHTAAAKTRVRKKSYVLQEQIALNDAASAVERKLEISQIKLIQRRLESLAGPAEAERQGLLAKVRSERDSAVKQKTGLEAEIVGLKARLAEAEERSPEKVIVRDTSETDALQAKLTALSAACESIPDKETVAMRVFVRLGERAAEFLTACGIDWKSWVLMSRNYSTRQAMENVVNACIRETADSHALRYCRLRLNVEFGHTPGGPEEFV